MSNGDLLKKIDDLKSIYDDGSKTTTSSYNFDKATFIGGKNIIITGTPGCGKSYYVQNELLKNYPKDTQGEFTTVIRTTFFPEYSNTDFVGQLLPQVQNKTLSDGTQQSTVTYDFIPGPFTLALQCAIENPGKPVALVIEEINRGNAASIFGDIFQLLDRKKDGSQIGSSMYSIVNTNIQRYLTKFFEKSDGYIFNKIMIPANLSIFATMNSSDQNVFTLDTAFQRRWDKMRLKNQFNPGPDWKDYFVPGMGDVTWEDLVLTINQYIVSKPDLFMNEDKQLGIYFIDKDTLCEEKFDINNSLDKEKMEKFGSKILEYLWNDISKFDHNFIFSDVNTLDDMLTKYEKLSSNNQGEQIFSEDLRGKLTSK